MGPAGPTGTLSAPRAKAECVQMAALRARPSGLIENPGASGRPPRWFAIARPDGRAAAEVPMRAHLLPHAQPGLQEVGVRRTPSWSSGPGVLDRPPPRTLVRWVSPPNLAAQRADCRPGSSQHRTPIDWAHLVRLGMDCLASLGCCFKQRASNPARDRPTRGPAVPRKALPGRAKAKQPGSLRPPSGPTRVERGRVAPGPGKPPPLAVRAPECRRPPPPPPSAFSPAARNDRSVGRPCRSRPAGTHASPAQAAPRPGRLHPAEAAGARRFPCDRPVQDGPRRARGYSPQQVRLPG
ncbi:hypothetical protein NDU88_005639 [Pleurodeles waltl]|uniref:Basic proline-rich protein-like n=1 Tax=Pleurodeles waltl TaxID=8319 RepID=A0AAV7SM98_PLEWA|nr:hypothetical protein NDU88_005639 [Pleurodeles waltl]